MRRPYLVSEGSCGDVAQHVAAAVMAGARAFGDEEAHAARVSRRAGWHVKPPALRRIALMIEGGADSRPAAFTPLQDPLYPAPVSGPLRIEGIRRPAEVEFTYAGRRLRAPEGESLAAALLAAGLRRLGEGPGAPRAALCMMGVCQQCLVRVEGRPAQACLVLVRAGLLVDPA
jgi:ferredoxin